MMAFGLEDLISEKELSFNFKYLSIINKRKNIYYFAINPLSPNDFSTFESFRERIEKDFISLFYFVNEKVKIIIK